MVRPRCYDKLGLKKGPWSPDEDIMLVTYVQEHGPENWRVVSTKSGLRRCSKSCRLRWINYLRPGIKRGNFTESEDKMIIHLQALLGNRWAAIASYMPERTDNDIKNYWNTHLKKKLKELHGVQNKKSEGQSTPLHSNISKFQWETNKQTSSHTAKQALNEALSIENLSTLAYQKLPSSDYYQNTLPPSLYDSSTRNMANLLPNGRKNGLEALDTSYHYRISQNPFYNMGKEFEPQFNLPSANFDGSNSISVHNPNAHTFMTDNINVFLGDKSTPTANQGNDSQVPYNMFDSQLFDDCVAQ